MTLTPPTNIAPATVAVAGTVDVSDRAARLLGHVSVDNFPADQLVHFTTPVAVTGPLTNAELRAADVGVDGSAHTQPISAAALPLPAGAATEATLATLATEATLQAVEAALAGLATDATAADVLAALNDVALTAILERDKLEP